MDQVKYVKDGVWGGAGARLSVGPKGAAFDFACSTGEVSGRLKLDAKGKFSVRGVLVRPSAGPLRKGAPDNRQPALFEGSLKGEVLTVSVTALEVKEPAQTFTLKLGAASRITRCM